MGTGVGLGTAQLVPEWQLAAFAGGVWLVGAALFVLGYQRLPFPVDSTTEHPWWKVTTRWGWVGMVAVLTVGMAAFYAVFARVVVTVPAPFELWLTVSMASMGPGIAGLVGLLGTATDSPFVGNEDAAG